MNYTVYHNSRCSKSRCALQYIEKQGDTYDIVDYLNISPKAEELKELLKKLEIKAENLIRKGEVEFKDNYKGKVLSETEWIAAMVKYPKLIERPIIILGDKAVIGRPTEKIDELK